MKATLSILLAVVAVLGVGAAVYMIDIDQTQETRLPEVTVEGGQLPAFDAEVGDVSVTEETVDVTVPEVDVTLEEKSVTVPGIKIIPPSDDG
ncbi:hypothetical protein KUV51_17325 [Tateyamaria omphalii]|uniref:hypothetical protein n=1 Tax=Tateyamaria omphalii TaxID=299262 RepID=UPI001C99EFED|nr:hypothetical protein [Tateyamaria omphalii]MBY5934772.1 hypothetical protein [Tateyamaria omphalii]